MPSQCDPGEVDLPDPSAPRVQAEPQAERLAKKYGISLEQVKAMNDRLIGEARKEGLDFHLDDSKGGNTFDAHRLIHFGAAGERAGSMKERLMLMRPRASQ